MSSREVQVFLVKGRTDPPPVTRFGLHVVSILVDDVNYSACWRYSVMVTLVSLLEAKSGQIAFIALYVCFTSYSGRDGATSYGWLSPFWLSSRREPRGEE